MDLDESGCIASAFLDIAPASPVTASSILVIASASLVLWGWPGVISSSRSPAVKPLRYISASVRLSIGDHAEAPFLSSVRSLRCGMSGLGC